MRSDRRIPTKLESDCLAAVRSNRFFDMTEGDEIDDRESPDESDMDSSDDPDLVRCPYCRQLISEDAECCPNCKSYLSHHDVPRRIRWWILAGAIAALAAAL